MRTSDSAPVRALLAGSFWGFTTAVVTDEGKSVIFEFKVYFLTGFKGRVIWTL